MTITIVYSHLLYCPYYVQFLLLHNKNRLQQMHQNTSACEKGVESIVISMMGWYKMNLAAPSCNK